MWVHDVDTLRILAANEAAVRQYGWTREQLLSKTVLDLLPPDDHPAFLEELLTRPWDGAAQAPAQGSGSGSGPARRHHRTRDGVLLTVEVQTNPLPFEGRRGMLLLARDVTERDALRAAIETTGDQLREAQSVAKVGIWEWDIPTNQVRWSDELYRIFGISPQAFPGTYEGYLAAVHPDDRALVTSSVDKSLHTLEPFDFAHRCLLPDGAVRWLQCRGRSAASTVSQSAGRPLRRPRLAGPH